MVLVSPVSECPMATSRSRHVAYARELAVVTLTYFFLGKYSLLVAIPPGNASAIWPAGAVALCACLAWGKRSVPAIFAGALLTNLTTGISFTTAALIAVGNTMEAAAAAVLIQRYLGDPPKYESGDAVLKFVAIAAASSLIAASLGALSLLANGYVQRVNFLQNWLTWWSGDTTGIVIFAPLMMSLQWFDRSWSNTRLVLFLAFSLLLAAMTHIVFSVWEMPYLVLALVIWAAYQFGLVGVSVIVSLIAAITIGDTIQGLGPFADAGNMNRSLLRLQAYMSVVGVAGITLSVLVEQARALIDKSAKVEASLRAQRDALDERVRDRTAALVRDIEARKAGEKLLGESEERYRMVVELSPDGIFIIDTGNTYLFANPAGLALCGATSLNQVVGRSVFDFFFPSFHPYLRNRFQRLKCGHLVPPCEEQFIRLDGAIVDVEAHAAHFMFQSQPATLVILREIATRKAAEQSLRLTAQVFENSREGILITDQERRIVSVNRAFTAITGYEAVDIIGEMSEKLRSDFHDARFYEYIWKTIAETGHWQGEVISRRSNGQLYPTWNAVSALRDCAGIVTNYLLVFSDISERKEAESRIQFMAEHDALTALPTRALLFDRLDKAAANSRRNRKQLAILFIDLDRFKYVNDSMGHNTGDKLLQAVADRLRKVVRDVDTVSRLGGDEFVVMLIDIGSAAQVAHIAGNVVQAIAAPYNIDGHELNVTSSIGISTYPDDTDNVDDLIKNADTAMYSAKACGRNNFQFFSNEMNQRALARLTLEGSLRKAIEQEEFILEYQPEIDIASGRMLGVEALIRWRHPKHGLLQPSSFIALSEDSGLIIAIGEWVLRTACRQAKAWCDIGLQLVVAVNLSVAQFRQKHLLRSVMNALHDASLEPQYLELEITENILIDGADTTLDTLLALRKLGVKLAVDDFGTGYSSLSYLKRLKVDKLKIDQSFISEAGVGTDDAAIVGAIIAMAKQLKLRVIAEGVETVEQYVVLKALACDEYQGFYASRALPPAEVTDFIALHA
jgi:diguanylate cyclase (GGDEF)-like protein/PAS domain S-box-containing protein